MGCKATLARVLMNSMSLRAVSQVLPGAGEELDERRSGSESMLRFGLRPFRARRAALSSEKASTPRVRMRSSPSTCSSPSKNMWFNNSSIARFQCPLHFFSV